MRITKEIAAQVAKQLCAEKQEKLKSIQLEEQKIVRAAYLKTIPKPVLECFEGYADYFRKSTSVYINGPGLPVGYKKYPIGDQLPAVNGERITVTEKESNKIQKLEDQISDLTKEIDTLKANIEVALYNLRTYANVEKEFPEAYKLLPAYTGNTSLTINISDIRCQLGAIAC